MSQRNIIKIHAKKTGNHRWYGQYNRNRRQEFHDDIEIIGNNGGERIHHTAENAAVNVSHLNRLFILDDNIL